jgi:hypothetical protein
MRSTDLALLLAGVDAAVDSRDHMKKVTIPAELQ